MQFVYEIRGMKEIFLSRLDPAFGLEDQNSIKIKIQELKLLQHYDRLSY